nr:CotH kinase family protein [Candidatus Delongbacteria bacterium]
MISMITTRPASLKTALNFRRIMILIAFSLVWQVAQAQAASSLVINEFMADNAATMQDPTDQSYDDWVELYNAGSQTLSLQGYYLTDAPADPCQWAFPDTSLAPGEWLLIWTDSDNSDPGLHANFKLSKGGEFLGLFRVDSQDTVAIDSLTFGSQSTDISYGRYPDGSDQWQSFTTPTPGSRNTTEITEIIDSSFMMFDTTKVYRYDLSFYYDGWSDSLEYYYENGEKYIPAKLVFEGKVLDSIGVRYKGNSSYQISRSTPKKPFKFKFPKYKSQILYGIAELNFSNCVKDPSFMREVLSYRIMRQWMPASRTAYAEIYIDGNLIGLYTQVEEVDEYFLERRFTQPGGNLYKAGDDGCTLEYLGTDQSAYEAGLEIKTNEDANDYSGLIEMIGLLNQTSDQEFTRIISQRLDLDNCCRLMALNMVLSNFDSYLGSARNYYLYDDPETGLFKFIPWDLNESFGAYTTNNWNAVTLDIVNPPNLPVRPIFSRIIANDSLRSIYLNYIRQIIENSFTYAAILQKTQEIQPLIDAHVQADTNKLYSYANFTSNIQSNVTISLGITVPGMSSFTQNRLASLQTQLNQYQTAIGASNLNHEAF